MEINITQLVNEDLFQFSHSRAEGGQNAGENTWQAAMNGPRPLLDSEEKLQAMREWARSSGGWTKEEIAEWSENEIQALFLQLVSGDVREAGADCLEEIEWGEYQNESERGRVSGRLYKSGDEYFIYIGE